MFAKLSICILGFELVACGGMTGNDGLTTGTGGTNAGGGSTTAGSILIGGSAGAANTGGATGSGGSSSGDNCPSTTVDFQVVPAPNSTTSWCIGIPSNCLGVGVTILDAGGALEQSSLCQVDCESCTRNPCPPLPCLQPEALTDSGIALSWSGMYLASSSCGSASTSCASTRCAAPGQYQVQACGFVNANPSSSDGCLVSSYRDYTCVLVSFDYPPPAGAPVVIAMPAQP
jgi:hypothetical protein